MTNAKSFLQDAKNRYNLRTDNREMMRKYLNGVNIDKNFECMGGSKNQIFFNSFSGLSAAVSHRVAQDFKNEIEDEFKKLDLSKNVKKYDNGIEHASLPHFRLLFNNQPVLYDSLRVLIFTIEKSNLTDKEKIFKWINIIFTDLMQVKLPNDVQNHKVEEFFENIIEEDAPLQIINSEVEDVELTRKIITR